MPRQPTSANERKQPEGTMPEEVFARRVAERRRLMGWSQTTLAKNLGDVFSVELDGTAITRIEQGKRRVRLDEAVAITQLLGMDLHEVTAPHPGGLEDQIANAISTVDNATYAYVYWERELEQAWTRLEELRGMQAAEQERRDRMRELVGKRRQQAEDEGDINALAGYDVIGDGDDRFDQEEA